MAEAVDAAAKETRERDKRITELERQLSLVSAAVVPINEAFKAILIKELTHYHTPELDHLLTKIGPPSTLTPADEIRMTFLLEERTHDMADEISESERDAAIMLPLVIKRTKLDPLPDVELLVVGIPIEAPAEK